jgi:hypothetical protein
MELGVHDGRLDQDLSGWLKKEPPYPGGIDRNPERGAKPANLAALLTHWGGF